MENFYNILFGIHKTRYVVVSLNFFDTLKITRILKMKNALASDNKQCFRIAASQCHLKHKMA